MEVIHAKNNFLRPCPGFKQKEILEHNTKPYSYDDEHLKTVNYLSILRLANVQFGHFFSYSELSLRCLFGSTFVGIALRFVFFPN